MGRIRRLLGLDVPVYVHPTDADGVLHPEGAGALARVAPEVGPPPAAGVVPLDDGEVLHVGPMILRARHTPGHTPGSTCLLVEGGARPLLLSGDTLFAGGTGRCDLEGDSRSQAEASLRGLLASLPDATVVLPGHRGGTTVGRERANHVSRPTRAA